MKKKSYLAAACLLLFMLVLSACGGAAGSDAKTASPETGTEAAAGGAEEAASGTVTYESESGPVQVPANPTRIVALTNAPNVLSLGVTPVGVDQWTGNNPLFTEKLKGVTVVTEEDPESVAALAPDLIIAGSTTKNLDQLNKIAPTVVYTWGKLNYLDQQVAVGKLLGKEAEAQAWVDDFTKRASEIGGRIKAEYGDDVTVSVMEVDGKSAYVMGDSWARGTEILYQAMGLKMPDKVKEAVTSEGYYSLSLEVLPEYMGDFIAVSRKLDASNEIMGSEVWKQIPAVKEGHVIEFESRASSYSDPTTLENLLGIFEKGFLGDSK
ncbi:iron-hydroxamate ABC transporter substrate-binding protein [Saccharibacillus alkalitolerans]|uniref:Iron-hydroxamate ABC transporter substrate-binding protein n=1 Tax=Saccharibacillus alkalitolerans TaxID=2705290 RepID=A0ABX0FA03_9BACL|nr:iron-hydroxamate ABC transporter substrate-binding protein [Saccharibacillus alkalitolerans]NGZ77747.1 iron-hydroxamate ABC transporter substrate-binding protein [Saccharibacillus alkalitolerans]